MVATLNIKKLKMAKFFIITVVMNEIRKYLESFHKIVIVIFFQTFFFFSLVAIQQSVKPSAEK
jgi:hypothetical protein